MNINIKDQEITVNGIVYVPKEKTLQGVEKFEVGKWYYAKTSVKESVFRVSDIKDGLMHFESNGETYKHSLADTPQYAEIFRPATPAEIEAHLRKICDEKYRGKRVRCLLDKREFEITSFWEMNNTYDIVYHTKSEIGCWVYRNGKWAEVLPDKKPVPKTKPEFDAFLYDYQMDNEHYPRSKFLDQYDFND